MIRYYNKMMQSENDRILQLQLPATLFSVDILARSQKTIDRRKALGDVFMREITSKGKTLYARPR